MYRLSQAPTRVTKGAPVERPARALWEMGYLLPSFLVGLSVAERKVLLAEILPELNGTQRLKLNKAKQCKGSCAPVDLCSHSHSIRSCRRCYHRWRVRNCCTRVLLAWMRLRRWWGRSNRYF